MPQTKKIAKKKTKAIIKPAKKAVKKPVKKAVKKLSGKEVKYFKNMLLEQKQAMFKEFLTLKENALNSSSREAVGDLSGLPLHQADIASDVYETDFLLRLASDERDRLYEIDDALKKIEEKTYGQCADCSCMIPLKRLEAFPQAQKCIKCKQKAEAL